MGFDLAAVRQALAKPDRASSRIQPESVPEPGRPWAAVLCLLQPGPGGLGIVLERRPMGPSFFGGHLSFPGGKLEASDPDPWAAALRETEEEIGVAPDAIEPLGLLTESIDPRGRPVSCFVGHLPGPLPALPRSPAEVEEMLVVDVASLLHPGPAPSPPGRYAARSHESRLWPANEKLVQYWRLEAAGPPPREAVLWGFTAGLVSLLLHRVTGWEPPGAPRIVSAWEDLRPEPAVPT